VTIPHELDEVLETEERREAFRVNDDGAAEWAIKRLAEIRAVIAEHRPLRSSESYFEHLLGDYARRQRQDADRKTIALPHGKVSTRWGAAKFSFDEERFLAWAEVNLPEIIRIKKEPWVAEMRERLVIQDNQVIDPASGQIVDGVVASSPELSITIKTEENNE
jgi:hypothetical protein